MKVTTRYSNPPGRAADLRKLLAGTSVRQSKIPETRPLRQYQRRLHPNELRHLVADYVSGVEVMELARRYRIARGTVVEHMRRQGVPRRHPRLSSDDIRRVAGLYQAGDSLSTVGKAFGVDPGTVRRALTELGVPVRDCHGRDGTSLA